MAEAMKGTTKAAIVSCQPNPATSWNMARIMTSVGIIKVTRTRKNTIHLPGNLKYTKARPASIAVTVFPPVTNMACWNEFIIALPKSRVTDTSSKFDWRALPGVSWNEKISALVCVEISIAYSNGKAMKKTTTASATWYGQARPRISPLCWTPTDSQAI